MGKDKLMEVKKRLLVVGLANIVIRTTRCSNSNKNEIFEIVPIPLGYSNVDDYYRYVIQDGEAVQVYNSQNVYLLFNFYLLNFKPS